MDRRAFLRASIGCSLAASPWVTPVSFAASDSGALGENRLVVIILRGAMDGLDVVQPYGDPALPGLRRTLGFGPGSGAMDLDGFFSLHPRLAPLMPLWQAGQLGFAHAVSTPYRDKRSHFDGQDLLEAGVASLAGRPRDGWLNRLLGTMAGVQASSAYSIGQDRMALMSGDAPVSDWSPDIGIHMTPEGQRLLDLVMHEDPLFQEATAEALDILASLSAPSVPQAEDGEAGMMDGMAMMEPAKEGSTGRIADFAATRLRGDTRIAAFSLGGWDTHANQRRNLGRALAQLSETILRLRQGLGGVWDKTTVVAMTEFGRTAHENGTGGTDHGTGGLALFAGGAIRGGRVYGDWPGLSEADLYARRDLMPTRDVRAYAGWALRDLYGLDRSIIETVVFPGLDMGQNPGLIA